MSIFFEYREEDGAQASWKNAVAVGRMIFVVKIKISSGNTQCQFRTSSYYRIYEVAIAWTGKAIGQPCHGYSLLTAVNYIYLMYHK